MNFKDLFNKAVTEAQSFLDKPETKELIYKVKQGAVEFKQKAEVFVEESDEKLKKIIEEKFSKKNDNTSDTEIKNEAEDSIKTTEYKVQDNTTFTQDENSVDIATFIFSAPTALILGNEVAGIPNWTKSHSDFHPLALSQLRR